jgi:prepilin-type N-terminal cleavage/methylation domain-containing protein
MITQKNNGFTLIELLVVIAVIALLSSMAIISLNSARSRARDTKRLADIKQLMTVLDLYYNDNGHYPRSAGCNPAVVLPYLNFCNSVETLSDGHWIKHNTNEGVLSAYMTSEPVNPTQGSTASWAKKDVYYYYAPDADAKWYLIVYKLENFPNPLENQDGVTNCGGTLIHYGSGSNGVITVGVSCSK